MGYVKQLVLCNKLMQFNNSCILQLFGCTSTWSGRDTAFYEFKTQFTAGRAVRVGLLGSRVLKGL